MGSLQTHTLGCKVNHADVQAVAECLPARGNRLNASLVGTCCVTAEGEKQSRQEVRRAARRVGPGGRVFVTGCAARLKPETFSGLADNVVVVAGEPDEAAAALAAVLDGAGPAAAGLQGAETDAGAEAAAGLRAGAEAAAPGRTRFFLKIQDGCANGCSYCVIPQVRGRPRSVPLEKVRESAAKMIAAGFSELVVTGINAGSWRDGGLELADLLEVLAAAPGLKRLRLSSIEAGRVTPRLLEVMQRRRAICGHLHLPLQSGDDGVLAAMGRRYDAAAFMEAVSHVRAMLPEVNLTTDVIAGFPGEDEAAFENTMRLVEAAGFSKVHVFTYSPRPGTAAALMGDTVPPGEKKCRSLAMRKLSERLQDVYRQRKVGLTSEILLESPVAPGVQGGYSTDYTRFEVRGGAPGEVALVRGTGVSSSGVVGEVIEHE
ncbi:MAG: MiaB/RimO family radical SAM methylthiotransferase [Thermoleophilia bacterium]